jgi:hypothetical protein
MIRVNISRPYSVAKVWGVKEFANSLTRPLSLLLLVPLQKAQHVRNPITQIIVKYCHPNPKTIKTVRCVLILLCFYLVVFYKNQKNFNPLKLSPKLNMFFLHSFTKKSPKKLAKLFFNIIILTVKIKLAFLQANNHKK